MTAKFSIFRYQLVPLSTRPQLQLFEEKRDYTYEELVANKNAFFNQILSDPKTMFRGRGYGVISKIEFSSDHEYVVKLGVEKNKRIYSSDFHVENIRDYPNVAVYINNAPDKQYIVIEHNSEAFYEPKAVANILQEAFSKKLIDFDLAIYIEQTFDSAEFWDTIRKYEGTITALKFEFIKPNMSNISGEIKKVFKDIENNTNSHRTNLNFHAPADGVLENLNEGNDYVSTLLSYNREGGGPPPLIKVKGFKTTIKTVNSEKTITIAEFEGSAAELARLLNSQLQ